MSKNKIGPGADSTVTGERERLLLGSGRTLSDTRAGRPKAGLHNTTPHYTALQQQHAFLSPEKKKKKDPPEYVERFRMSAAPLDTKRSPGDTSSPGKLTTTELRLRS